MLMQRRPEPQKSWEFPASWMQGFCGAFKIHRRQGSALQLEHSCCPSAWTKLLLREDQVLWLLLLIVESRRDPRAADDEAEAWCAPSRQMRSRLCKEMLHACKLYGRGLRVSVPSWPKWL